MGNKSIIISLAAFVFFCTQNIVAQHKEKPYYLTSNPKNVTSENGKKLTVESGMFYVPENRGVDGGRTISIAYYRIKSKSKVSAKPIFLLAGGPGGSYIDALAKEELFDEATFYSSFADVVIFDQRGAGNSVPSLTCKGEKIIPINETLSRENLQDALRKLALECRAYWKAEGVDISAYNTDESASDINDLRKAFGYDKIILIGGSYGAHLGLHTLRKFPDIVERAIFHGVEGPDHTWDMPSHKLNVLERIALSAENSDYFNGKIPNKGLMYVIRQVIKRIEKKPKKVVLRKGDHQIDVLVDKFAAQAALMYRAGKRNRPLDWPNLILNMYYGDYTIPAKFALSLHKVSAPNAMSNAMDFASGVSDERRSEIKNDKAIHILGDINYGYTMREGIWNEKDLGTNFRKNVQSEVPVLLVHGTWDIATPIENAHEVLMGLKNGHLIEVVEGTHNALYELYEYNSSFPSLVVDFISGNKNVFPAKLTLPPIEYPVKVSPSQETLWDACISGNLQKAENAIAKGADVNALDTRKNNSGRCPLHWAAFYGHKAIVGLLLDNGAQINEQNKTGYTPIHHAVENNKKAVVDFLKEEGADFKISNVKGYKPIDTAILKGFHDIIDILK
ncbi:alpha/beta fold hydrolase [Muricauda sp. NFXS6]|uniref:alpha/beta fold hydrolase n=1 Tax=Allomuricauda sp. NFXS6 TaxID=2819094 RepID=UPI0032DFB5BA